MAETEAGDVVLAEEEWQALARRHEEAVTPWIDAYRARRDRRETHPVHDFLFTYYRVKRGVLKRWRPSAGKVLQGAAARTFLADERYREDRAGVRLHLAKLDDAAVRRIQGVMALLKAAKARPPRFNCFGLHEWAMVYKADEVRHETTPLRVSSSELERIVESSTIRCSHFDAFRFFTREATGLNALQPKPELRAELEQFGCVHFNMDLYRWSCKLSPWVGSEVIREAFRLALKARELDMRASPYDLGKYGYEPILIETPEGREQYQAEQYQIYRAGQSVAERLLAECALLLEASTRR